MKIVEIGESYGDQYILFDNEKKLEYIHDQECCEEVYADFKNMQVIGLQDKNFMWASELDFFENLLTSVVPIEGVGFYLVTKQGICILVSCYNVQNGYYSDELKLCYDDTYLDITGCTEDEYY